MHNKVTDLETSRLLHPHMSGVETDMIWAHFPSLTGTEFEWSMQVRAATPKCFIKYPAYDLQDILGVLPSYIKIKEVNMHKPWKVGDRFYLMIVKRDSVSGGRDRQTFIIQYARGYAGEKGTGRDKILRVPVHPANGISAQTTGMYQFANRFEGDKSLTLAAAQLLLWTVSEGYVGGGK